MEKTMKRELYFSLDVEADGPIPGPNSMLSFAAVVFDPSLGAALQGDWRIEHLDRFTVNLETLPGAEPDTTTMEFWKRNQAAYEATRQIYFPPPRPCPASRPGWIVYVMIGMPFRWRRPTPVVTTSCSSTGT